ncbi:NAD(P)/FAD-dependent oxidoreductase [Candidatus Neomarinimicrobiota bacterium]
MVDRFFDVIIVGGGPAGAAATLYARRLGMQTLLVDKAAFPRDKVCGDALSGKSVEILRDLDLLEKTAQLPGAAIRRIIFTSPAHTELEIDLTKSSLNQIPEGYVIRRRVFDAFLFEEARNAADECLEEFTVKDLVREDGYVSGVRGILGNSSEELTFRSRIVLGADGFNSIVARKTGLYRHESRHMIVALRQYFENVQGLTDQIELHFIDEVIPGYFWIFPLENGYANVGIGMIHSALKAQHIDLRAALAAAMDSSTFRERFAQAVPQENPVGWNLPVGSRHSPNVGDGFLLLGDAAGLIDPFTGEGIGNALYSARVAVMAARQALDSGDVSKNMLGKLYDRPLWDAIGSELQNSTRLQRLGQWRWLLNFVIRKASRNKEIAEMIGGMITNEVPRQKLANPAFYLKLLLK